jgi:hypothetical protein
MTRTYTPVEEGRGGGRERERGERETVHTCQENWFHRKIGNDDLEA